MKTVVILAFALVFALSGCTLIPIKTAPHLSKRTYCKSVAKEGWCDTHCGHSQPPECLPYRRLSTGNNGFSATYESIDGTLFFAL